MKYSYNFAGGGGGGGGGLLVELQWHVNKRNRCRLPYAWFPLARNAIVKVARSKQVLAYCKCISHNLRHQSDPGSFREVRKCCHSSSLIF